VRPLTAKYSVTRVGVGGSDADDASTGIFGGVCCPLRARVRGRRVEGALEEGAEERSMVSRETSSEAMFRTRTAESWDASLRIKLKSSVKAAERPGLLDEMEGVGVASQMLRTMRRRLRRMMALLWESFWMMRPKRSARAREEATGGERRRSFWRGSRRFSKAFALEVVKHFTMEVVKSSARRCSSTLAVSSWSL
jgi:hypothetical protein